MTNRSDSALPVVEKSVSALPAAERDACYQARLPCQVCGGPLIEIRAKLQCQRCHTIWETCCEGGRG
jgi:hypothetical protein